MNTQYTYGCLPAKFDARDYKLCSANAIDIDYPKEFCLDNLPRVKNQLNVNSCAAHATSTILEYFAHNQFNLSTNFIYGIQKKLFNLCGMGMYLKDALSIAVSYGDMEEVDCAGNDEIPISYSIAETAFTDATKLKNAHKFRLNSYYLCQTDNDIKYALMNYGPVLGAIYWRNKFYIDKDNVVIFNKASSGGGHAITIIGWTTRGWLILNSWGTDFADLGRFILPYDYGFMEVRAVIDCDNDNELNGTVLDKPYNNKVLNIFYKVYNFIINMIKLPKKYYQDK